jgi:hypothetical protein
VSMLDLLNGNGTFSPIHFPHPYSTMILQQMIYQKLIAIPRFIVRNYLIQVARIKLPLK